MSLPLISGILVAGFYLKKAHHQNHPNITFPAQLWAIYRQVKSSAKLKTGVGLNVTFLVKCYTLYSNWLHHTGARILSTNFQERKKKDHRLIFLEIFMHSTSIVFSKYLRFRALLRTILQNWNTNNCKVGCQIKFQLDEVWLIYINFAEVDFRLSYQDS